MADDRHSSRSKVAVISRCEVFEEADLEAALARFEQLSPPAPRLENSATRVWERLYSYIAAGDWQSVAQITAENVSVDDRRRVVNAGILHGRDANIKDAQATIAVGFTMKKWASWQSAARALPSREFACRAATPRRFKTML